MSMPRQCSYAEWREAKLGQINPDEQMMDCEDCDGLGMVECECCNELRGCRACEGEGEVSWIEGEGEIKPLSLTEYRKEVFRDLKDWCLWTNADFLELAGQFVKRQLAVN